MQINRFDLPVRHHGFDLQSSGLKLFLLQAQFPDSLYEVIQPYLPRLNGFVNPPQALVEVPVLEGEYLSWDQVWNNYEKVLTWLSVLYSRTMNCIHYMHDKYNYERVQMALIDSNPRRSMAFGAAGLSVVADSLSAIKYSKVKAVRNEHGIAVRFEIDGKFPCYGNDDDRVDGLAVRVIRTNSNWILVL